MTRLRALACLAANAEYSARFRAAFPGDPSPVSVTHLPRAFAAFARTMVT